MKMRSKRFDYSKVVKALVALALVLVTVLRSMFFIAGQAKRQTNMPNIAPAEIDCHRGMPRAMLLPAPATIPITRPIPMGFSAICNIEVARLSSSFCGSVICKRVHKEVNNASPCAIHDRYRMNTCWNQA